MIQLGSVNLIVEDIAASERFAGGCGANESAVIRAAAFG